MADAHPSSERLRGGCQCGAVRYSAPAEPMRTSVCHCRMCQRAVGNVFAPLLEVDRAALVWETAEPAVYASSTIAERGFCARCGTPLFFRDIDGDTVELMIGALDHPERAAPSHHYGAESRLAWLDSLADLPAYDTGCGPDDKPDAAPIVSRQAQISD